MDPCRMHRALRATYVFRNCCARGPTVGSPTKPQKSATIMGSWNGNLGRKLNVGNSYRRRRVLCRFFRSLFRESGIIGPCRHPSQLVWLTEFLTFSWFSVAKGWLKGGSTGLLHCINSVRTQNYSVRLVLEALGEPVLKK
jgi:hypothetical protein